MLDKAYAVRGSLIDTSIQLSREALRLSREAGESRCISRSLSILSLCLMITGEYDESMSCAEEAINIFEELGDEKGIADAKYNIAGIYYKTDNPNIGLVFLKECLETYQQVDDYHSISKVYKSMGTIFEYFDDQKSAIYAYEQSIEAGIAAGDPNLESNAYNPLSGIYLNTGQVKKAMELIEKSIDMKLQTGDKRGLGFALYGRGKVYTKMEMHAAAEKDFKEALDIHLAAKDPLGIGMAYNKLASLYIEIDNLEAAKQIIHENIHEAGQSARIKMLSFKSYFLLYQIAKKEGDHKAALRYLEQHYQEKESVINSRTLKVIESYETIHKMRGLEHEAETQKEKADIIQKKNLELDSFFYRISHDLKIPINELKRSEFLLKEGVGAKESQQIANDLGGEIKAIERILDELIRVTRVNHLSDVKEKINFQKLIDECIKSYKFLVNFDEVDISYEIDDTVKLLAEWALINAILQNLLENAIKFADLRKPSPYVKIEIRQDQGKTVSLTVSDNGVGIAPEQQETIMDMFYRPNKHIKNPGMGLFIIYRAVENLKAKVKFESTLGKGTSFTILIPSQA
jgi:signal transduction histidine kinase